MTVGIYKNNHKEEAAKCFEKLCNLLEKEGIDWFSFREEDRRPDMCIGVGGDGTFLKAAAFALKYDVPVFGLNLGTLGMLTEMDAERMDEVISAIKSNSYEIEKRSSISVTAVQNGKSIQLGNAVNDCVLSQLSMNKVAYLELLVNEEPVEIYPCDGLIISTQTGSTGYSLSAGGPIIVPGADVMVATPKCSHFVDGRSIVTGPDAVITVKVVRTGGGVSVSTDGRETITLRNSDKIICRKGERDLKIVRINPPGFFEALRTKTNHRDYIMEMRNRETK